MGYNSPALVRAIVQAKKPRMSFDFDLIERIRTVGQFGVIAVIFAESGLFFGFFVPGDGLLLTAGLRAARGEMFFKP